MKIIVTGSAGFIGAAFAHALSASPDTRVVGVDNLSRRGSAANLAWLERHAPNHAFEKLDVRSAPAMDDLLRRR